MRFRKLALFLITLSFTLTLSNLALASTSGPWLNTTNLPVNQSPTINVIGVNQPLVVVDGKGNSTSIWIETDQNNINRLESAFLPFGETNWTPKGLVSTAYPNESTLSAALTVNTYGFVTAIWISQSQSPNNPVQYFVKASSIGPSLTKWTIPTVLSSFSVDSMAAPLIAPPSISHDSVGNIFAVWQEPTDSQALLYQIKSAKKLINSNWSPVFNVSSIFELIGTNAFPQISTDPFGNSVAIWLQNNELNDVYVVYTSTLPNGSISWSAPFILSDSNVCSESPRISNGLNGYAVALWIEIPDVNGIVKAASLPFDNNWELPGVEISNPYNDAAQPEVAIDSSGNALAVWRELNLVDSTYSIYFSKLSFGGTWQPAQQIAGPAESITLQENGFTPTLKFDQNGNAVLVWVEKHSPAVAMAATLLFNAAVWTNFTQISQLMPLDVEYLTLDVDLYGNTVTVWYRGVSQTNIVQAAVNNQVLPPLCLDIKQKYKRFLLQGDVVNKLLWKQNDLGLKPVQYQIYRDSLTNLIATIPANGELVFKDHNRKKKTTYVYYVIAVTASGQMSNPAVIQAKKVDK